MGGSFRELLADDYQSSTLSKRKRREAEKAALEKNLESLVHPEITKSISPNFVTPTEKDVVFKGSGRTMGASDSEYHKLIEASYQDYSKDPDARDAIVQKVIESVMNNGGRFLDQRNKDNGAVVADTEAVKVIVNHSFDLRIRQQRDRERKQSF